MVRDLSRRRAVLTVGASSEPIDPTTARTFWRESGRLNVVAFMDKHRQGLKDQYRRFDTVADQTNALHKDMRSAVAEIQRSVQEGFPGTSLPVGIFEQLDGLKQSVQLVSNEHARAAALSQDARNTLSSSAQGRRHRGRPLSRQAFFLQLMFEDNPRLTRDPEHWLALDDELHFLHGWRPIPRFLSRRQADRMVFLHAVEQATLDDDVHLARLLQQAKDTVGTWIASGKLKEPSGKMEWSAIEALMSKDKRFITFRSSARTPPRGLRMVATRAQRLREMKRLLTKCGKKIPRKSTAP